MLVLRHWPRPASGQHAASLAQILIDRWCCKVGVRSRRRAALPGPGSAGWVLWNFSNAADAAKRALFVAAGRILARTLPAQPAWLLLEWVTLLPTTSRPARCTPVRTAPPCPGARFGALAAAKRRPRGPATRGVLWPAEPLGGGTEGLGTVRTITNYRGRLQAGCARRRTSGTGRVRGAERAPGVPLTGQAAAP